MSDCTTIFISPVAHRTVSEAAIAALGGGTVSLIIRLTDEGPNPPPQATQTHCGMANGSCSAAHAAAYSIIKQTGVLPTENIETGAAIPWGQTVDDVTYPSEADVLAAFAACKIYFKDDNSLATNFANDNLERDNLWIIPDDVVL